MQERYTLKLEILTDALKNSITQVKGMIHKFTNDVQKNNKINLGQMSVGNLYGEIGRAQQKIKEFNEQIARDKKLGVDTTVAEGNVKRLNDFISAANQRLGEMGAKRVNLSGLDKTKEKVEDIGNEADNTKNKLSGISISANMTNNNIINGFKNSWKEIKRFAFSLLSLRGIYGLVRKASSAYLSQDTQLANQMQKTWASLGALMAPILEKIVKGIRIAAAYVNYFVKALTGKDLIGKAVKKINSYNKSLGGTAKAAKAVNKELTTMDEVTNLTFDDGNINNFNDDVSSMASGFDDFGDIKLDKKVTDILDTLAEKVKKVAKFLKPVIDWAIAHPGAVLTILGGAKLLSLLTGLTGASGLAGLLPLLKGLATIGVVAVGVDLIYSAVTGRHLIDDLKEIKKGMEEVADMRKANSENAAQEVKNAKTVAAGYKKLSNNYDENASKINSLNDSMINNNKTKLAQIDAIKREINIRPKWNKNQKEYAKQIKNVAESEKIQTDAMYENWKQGNTNAEQTRNLANAIRNQIEKYQELEKNTKKNGDAQKVYKDRVKELQIQLLQMTGKDYNARVSVNTTDATNKANTFKGVMDKFKNAVYTAKLDVNNSSAMSKANNTQDKLKNVDRRYTPTLDLKVSTRDAKNKLSNFATKSTSALVIGGIVNKVTKTALASALAAIPAYDVGTNYVPNDQLAMVHKGEAIIPKKFNNQQFFNNSNEETNALLIELNQNVIELRNRPNVLEVNGKELAQATYNDFQNEGSRLNQSMTIKRS